MGAGIGKEPLQSLINLGGGSGYHCVMIGLDGSGKTTILYRLKYGQYTNTVPTIGFNCASDESPAATPKKFSVMGNIKITWKTL